MGRVVEVDHFVPWALYPLDLGHNFVLAHRECNAATRHRLASEGHLGAWIDRNWDLGNNLAGKFDRIGMLLNLPLTTQVASWAYSAASAISDLAGHANETLVPLSGKWRCLLG
jgi:HNH endonuclease